MNLHKEIIQFLTPLPCMQNDRRRRAILIAAGVDGILAQIEVAGAPQEFVPLLVHELEHYGNVGQEPALVVFLREVATQVGPDKQTLIQRFCQQILYARTSSGLPGADRRFSVFHNLPQPDYGRFVGREAELAQLRKLLSPRSRHFVITIDGIGGIGKSALALEIAHHYLHQYEQLDPGERFDAIIWTSAKQTVLTGEGIRTRRRVLHSLSDIYTAIAVALQREDITRASVEMQDEVVSNALTRQRTLLIVDNLETVDDEAVPEFLRELPAPTKAIVTTRHRLDVAYPVRLTGMPWEDARQLIAQECAKKAVSLDEENMRRLFDRTGGVPLAIVWSIAQMGFGYNSEAVLQRLGQPTSDIARFCFAGSVERIKARPAYKLLLTLSLCADSASREALGYATELPELDRDDGLVELEKLSLMNKQADRFWLLPLTKQFAAAECGKSADKERLREKWVEYFRRLCEEYASKHWNWKNYTWLVAEGQNIMAIIDQALDSDTKERALPFARAARRYLEKAGFWDKLFLYGEWFKDIAHSVYDKDTQGWVSLHWLTWLYGERGEYDRAESCARESLALYQELEDLKGIYFAQNWLGRLALLKKEYNTAEDFFCEAMHAAQQHNDADGIALSHYYLGRYMRDREHWEEAKQHLEAIVEWCESHLDQSDLDITILMGAKGNLGFAMFHLGDYTGGRKLVQQSVNFFDQMNLQRYATSFRWRLTLIEHALGNRESALQYAQETMFWAAPERLHMEREFTETRTLLQELQDKERAATPTEKGETEETASSPSHGIQEGTHHHG